jgi:membrane-bound lytic murein transglycosylase D
MRPAVRALVVLVLAACASPRTEAPEPVVPQPSPAPAEAAPPPPAPPVELVEVPFEPVEPPPEESAPEAAIAASLAAYEAARQSWQEGRFEDAFGALDEAYGLMAGVEGNGDLVVAQEKEDLRRLISRLIVEIYASQRTTVGDMEASIPLVVNEEVEREIASFQGGERQQFLAAYQRSGLYRPMIVRELEAAGMPEQLSWLPMVESWFKERALSSARALGMWQFIASTGYRFGLQRTDWFDERMDPEKSTRAALAYLTELHDLFGDWMTALAAYNCGEARVLKVINQQHIAYFDQFWDLYRQLPTETRRYVPRFLATLAIVGDPERYGFRDLPEPLAPLASQTIETSRSARLEDLERTMGLAAGSLALLNPELRRGATPAEPYTLRVPSSASPEVLVAALAASPPPPAAPAAPAMTGTHRVRPGETLSVIAASYRTTVASLMDANGLRNANRIWPGQQLRVPAVQVTSSPALPASGRYTVRRGDSLWTIARRFGTTVDRLKRDNDLRSSSLTPGQSLVVASGSAAAARGGTYVVRRGDTLGSIAQAVRVPASQIAAANGLSLRSTIYPGQELVIPN